MSIFSIPPYISDIFKFISNFISTIISIINFIRKLILYAFQILIILIIIFIFITIYRIYKYFKKHSFEEGIKKVIDKITSIFENIFNNILSKMGLIKKIKEMKDEEHLIKQIKNTIIEDNLNIKFDDISGLNKAKQIIKEAIFIPKLIPEFFMGLREPWKALLFFGPPGTGKTLLAKAISTEMKGTFFNAKASSFASKWVGESEKLVKILFEMARENSPSVIFIDEIDSIARKRGTDTQTYYTKTLNELLCQMDGLELNNNVLVVAATNRPDDLDEAILRRFQKAVYIPLPDKIARKKMFELFLKNNEYEKNINFDKLATITEGYNGSDIYNLCKESSYVTLRNLINKLEKNNQEINKEIFKDERIKKKLTLPISYDNILSAFKDSKRSVSQESIKQYEQFLDKINGNF